MKYQAALSPVVWGHDHKLLWDQVFGMVARGCRSLAAFVRQPDLPGSPASGHAPPSWPPSNYTVTCLRQAEEVLIQQVRSVGAGVPGAVQSKQRAIGYATRLTGRGVASDGAR